MGIVWVISDGAPLSDGGPGPPGPPGPVTLDPAPPPPGCPEFGPDGRFFDPGPLKLANFLRPPDIAESPEASAPFFFLLAPLCNPVPMLDSDSGTGGPDMAVIIPALLSRVISDKPPGKRQRIVLGVIDSTAFD